MRSACQALHQGKVDAELALVCWRLMLQLHWKPHLLFALRAGPDSVDPLPPGLRLKCLGCLCCTQILEGNRALLAALGSGLWPVMVLLSEIVQTFILAGFW